MRPEKSASESRTEQTRYLRYEDINGAGRLFGGRLLAWIDEVGGITARRHARMAVTTAAIDHVQFLRPAFIRQTVIVCGHVTYVGNTSIEVCVDTYLEEMDGTRHQMNRAYVTMVTIDSEEKPTPVPYGLLLDTDEARADWDNALKRIELRKKRLAEGY
ncbi:MAG: acyl-CoA thioesterase [Lachnospiraceae bacterium]|jgi:acyl-CoA hydrolase|nr:acyl-CoA thioesterase [Lachnospiraceae bacterium]